MIGLGRIVGKFVAARANALSILLGIGILILAAFQFHPLVGLVALGAGLIAAGADVRRT